MESVSDFVITVDDTRRPFVCEKCGESFPEQAELLQHMSTRGHDILRNKPGNKVCIPPHLPTAVSDTQGHLRIIIGLHRCR